MEPSSYWKLIPTFQFIELDQLLVDYDNFFKEIMRVRKELQKHVEVSPIVRKGVNLRSHLLHRSACVSALRLIIMSTLGGGAKAKYDYEAASIKSVLRTATGCADESCAKVGIAVVQNTFVPKWAESSSNVLNDRGIDCE